MWLDKETPKAFGNQILPRQMFEHFIGQGQYDIDHIGPVNIFV